MKNLFFEGSSGVGKSSLILSALKDKMPFAGGFGTVRLFDGEQNIVGYKIADACEYFSVDAEYCRDEEDIFLKFEDKSVSFYGIIFSSKGVEYLERTPDTAFFLLDEIGGGELLETAFVKKLICVLKSNLPCIGVLKSRKNSACFARRALEKCNYRNEYEKLRILLESRSDTVIFNMDGNNSDKAKCLISEWKKNI